MLSLFTFWWTGVRNANANPNDWFADTSLRVPHSVFNNDFANAFPRNLYTEPFTSYSDSGIGIGSQITGTAETVGDETGIRNWIIQEAAHAGISGNPANLRISIKSIDQIQQGQQLQLPESTVHPLATTDGVNQALQDTIDSLRHSLPDASILGMSTGVLIAVGIGVAVLFVMKSPSSPVRYLRR